MARIRTIKPEFPQSESMGRVSRESRLLFILLWTLADDEGRLRGNSRMLASLLYPYDDDAKDLIDAWMVELEREDCLIRYKSAGDSYVQISNWKKHQKIDKPSKSKLPAADGYRDDNSRDVESIREGSSEDQGRDQGRDQGSSEGLPDSADARILCEIVGIFDIRDQESMHRCMIAFSKRSGKAPAQCIEHMAARWSEYQKQSEGAEWQWGSAIKFFMSGKWDEPKTWPKKDAKKPSGMKGLIFDQEKNRK